MSRLAASACVLASLLWVPALSAQKDPGAVARILSVQSASPLLVTLKVDVGYFYNGNDLDVFSPKGKTTAKPTFPKNIDMLMPGDSIAGVTLLLARPLDITGGVVAERGRYPDLAAARSSVPNAPAKAASAAPAAGAPSTTQVCPYTAKELGAALGITLEAGKGREMKFGGGGRYSCTYGEARGVRSVMTTQTVMSAADWAYSKSTWDKQKAGSFEAIAKDADGARWQINQGDLTGVTLVYLRNNSESEVRVNGIDMKNAAAVKTMRDKVLSLRRIP
jgi:hypothetical protein